MFPLLYIAEILHAQVSHAWIIIRAKGFFLRPKYNPQYISYRVQTGRVWPTNSRMDDNHASSSTVIYVNTVG